MSIKGANATNIGLTDKFKPLLNKLTERFSPPPLPDVLVNALKFSILDDDDERLRTALDLASDASVTDLPTFFAKAIFGPPKSHVDDATQAQRDALKAKLVSKFGQIPAALSAAFNMPPFANNCDILGELEIWVGQYSDLPSFVHSAMLERWPNRP